MVVLELAERGPPLGASARGCEDGLRRGLGGCVSSHPQAVQPSSRYRIHVRVGRRFSWPEHRRCNGDGGAGGAAEDLADLGAARPKSERDVSLPTDWSISSWGFHCGRGGAAFAMEGEWHSYAPDGREVLVRRRGEVWLVRCGQSEAHGKNLDVALTQAIRADVDVGGHAREVGYATWIRAAADTIDRPDLAAEQLDKAGALPPGERADGLARADA